MTFQNSPSAIDGAEIDAAMIRRTTFSLAGDVNGVVLPGDLVVSELDVPGAGVQIAAGVGVVLNRYQDAPNELYVVSNPGTHTVAEVDMPGVDASDKSYILAIVIGDPDFSQTGHPWMGSDDPESGEELTFQYVRPTWIEVSDDTVTELDVDYPALEIARLDLPASTATVTDSMLTDLTRLARVRQSQDIFVSPGGTWDNSTNLVRIPSGGSYGDWGPAQFAPTVKVPTWARRAIVVASINGIGISDTSVDIAGQIRTQLGAVSGPVTTFNFSIGGGAIRTNLQTGGEYDVESIAGTTVALRVEGFENTPGSPTTNQRLALQSGSQQIFDVRFFEE